MKKRQYKKSAEALKFKNCLNDDGVWNVIWPCGGYLDEWDSQDAWPYLVDRFHGDVNTIDDENSECGISWVAEHLFVDATPKNVLRWARRQAA